MTRKQRRLAMIGGAGVVLTVAAGLILFALNDKVAFFQTPSDIAEKPLAPGQRIRLGGLVKEGTVVRGAGTTITFAVTDTLHDLPVTFTGILPDLFREGQGVVAEGVVGPDGVFRADNVLAKHDETYMPKEVADALKERGVWEGDDTPAARMPNDKTSRAEPTVRTN